MRSSIFAKWVLGHPFDSHVVLPGVTSLILIGMYFSGSAYLQNLVAPGMARVPLNTARAFGVLEILQNVFLLCVIFYALRCFLASKEFPVRLFTFLLLAVSVFTFLGETDYGVHFIEYFTGEYGSLAQETWNGNRHNKLTGFGIQNVSYLKLATTIILLGGFVLTPMLLSGTRNPILRLLVPSKWMILTVGMLILLSMLAHGLDDAGFAEISGRPGNLYQNISEFRELNMYYLFLLYMAILHERIVARKNAPARHH